MNRKARRNFTFVRCEKCAHDGKCRHRAEIPCYCVKGCVVCEDTMDEDLERKAKGGR